MGRAYSQDLRDRVLAVRDRGMPSKQVADLFNVSCSWVRRIMQRRREDGQTSPRPCGGAMVVKIDMARLKQLVEQQPDATIRELHQRLDCDCCEAAVGIALNRLGYSFKKRQFMQQNRIDPMSLNVAKAGGNNSLVKTLDV